MGLQGELRRIEEVPENPRRFNGWGNVPDSFCGWNLDGTRWVRWVSRRGMRRTRDFNSRRILEEPNRYESTTRKRERPVRPSGIPGGSHWSRCRSSMGYNNLWFESRQPEFSRLRRGRSFWRASRGMAGLMGFPKSDGIATAFCQHLRLSLSMDLWTS